MFEIFIEYNFSAAHNLRNYKGKCENLHGHNYRVRTYICGKKLNKAGMLLDFSVLKKQLKKILSGLDHKYLNDIKPFDRVNPTAENIAKYIFEQLKSTINNHQSSINKVSVWETDNNCATYYEK